MLFSSKEIKTDISGSEKKGSESFRIKNLDKKYKTVRKQFLDKLHIRSHSVEFVTLKKILNLSKDFKIPEKGEQIRMRVQQSINLILILILIAEHHGKIDEATISTYTLNKEAWSVLQDMVAGRKIGKLTLFIASSYSFRDPDQYANLKVNSLDLVEKGFDVRLMFIWSHIKISLFRCGNNYYQHEGSMNYSKCNMAEQIVFENSKATYDYDYDFFKEIVKTGKKSDNKSLEIIC